MPGALADQDVVLHFLGGGVDHGDAIGRPEGDEQELAVLVKSMPTGCSRSGRTPGTSKPISLVTFQVAGSITDMVPPTSEETQSSLPSAVNFASRGRKSTSTLAISLRVALSMTCAMLVLSEVATVYLPSGLDGHAFRLDADRHLGQYLAGLDVHDGDERIVLVGDVDDLALGIDGHKLRIRAGLELALDLQGLRIDHVHDVAVAGGYEQLRSRG